jgi:hypothetical protein
VRLREECRCGSVFEVEDDLQAIPMRALDIWRGGHRCMPADEANIGRRGAGFAMATEPVVLHDPAGHINLEVRA